MKKLMLMLLALSLSACGYMNIDVDGPKPSPNAPPTPIFSEAIPVSSAVVKVSLPSETVAMMRKTKKKYMLAELLMSKAYAQVAQGAATVTVSYTRPGVNSFTLNPVLGSPTVSVDGDTLTLGDITVTNLDDNSLRVCTGMGAPANKCNRAYIRVFTLGSNDGFYNVADGYGLNVRVNGSAPIGKSSSAMSGAILGAAIATEHTIPNGTNRLRHTQMSMQPMTITADLGNAGTGTYTMDLVIQYSLGYVP